jgi:hypothetical protein
VTGSQTEAGFLMRMVEDLASVLSNKDRRGDDGQRHELALRESGDGHTTPREAYWTCSCGGWAGGDWVQTGYPQDWAPGEDPMDTFVNARAWLHHVWPSRYGEHMSTIMTETLRGIRQGER